MAVLSLARGACAGLACLHEHGIAQAHDSQRLKDADAPRLPDDTDRPDLGAVLTARRHHIQPPRHFAGRLVRPARSSGSNTAAGSLRAMNVKLLDKEEVQVRVLDRPSAGPRRPACATALLDVQPVADTNAPTSSGVPPAGTSSVPSR
jgi:hypothetical protein